MFLKVIGGVLVLISSCVLGVYYSFKAEYRINDLFEIKKALLLLISEIEFNLSPIAEATKNISLKVKKPVCDIFSKFSERLGYGNCSAGELWKLILEEKSQNTYFEKEDIENFISFGQTLGYLDKQQQSNNIEITVNYIDNKISELSEKSKKNKRMFRSLGFLGGFVIMVILF